MKRSLRPDRSVPPAVLARIKQQRVVGVTTPGQTVRVTARSGAAYHFLPSQDDAALPVDAPVYVWWAAAGFVCAAIPDVEAEEAHSRKVADQVRQARDNFAKARDERHRRLHDVDITV